MVRVRVDADQMYNGIVYTPDLQGFIEVPPDLAEALGAVTPEPVTEPDPTPPANTTTGKKKGQTPPGTKVEESDGTTDDA